MGSKKIRALIHNIYALLFICSLAATSCSQDKLYTEEIMEIHNVIPGDGDHKIGDILFSESEFFNPDGAKERKIQYDKRGGIKGVEIFDLSSFSKSPKKSKFYDGQDSLLSYYTMVYNSDDRLLRKVGFDASNDAMLRIEEFSYNSKGERTLKFVKSSDNFLQREYNFVFDDKGNEKSVITKDGSGKVILTEFFNITKYDKEGAWLEKWGFVDDKPVRYYIKSRRILKKKSTE